MRDLVLVVACQDLNYFVPADCGYIYASPLPFEDLSVNYVCPQCKSLILAMLKADLAGIARRCACIAVM